MVPATGVCQLVHDGFEGALTRCRFLTPMGFLDRIEAVVRSMEGRDRERKHGVAKSPALCLAFLPGPLATGHRDVLALSAHAAHEELIIDFGGPLDALLDRR